MLKCEMSDSNSESIRIIFLMIPQKTPIIDITKTVTTPIRGKNIKLSPNAFPLIGVVTVFVISIIGVF